MDLQKFVAINKFVFARGYSYIGALGIGFVIASTLQQHWPFQSVPLYYLYPAGVLLVWALGVIDVKGKFYAAESEYGTRKNPFFERMEKK